MNAYYLSCSRFGHPSEVLQLHNKPLEQPGPGELLVRMISSPINPSDLIPIQGAYAHRIALPMIPGYEGVGKVVEAGRNVSASMLGLRVLSLRGEGTWHDYVRVPAELAVPVPDTISDDTASQLYINPVTAWLLCQQYLADAEGDFVLINAAGSSIGRIFAQLSQVFGFRIIAAVRNDLHTEALLLKGAEYVINTSATSLHEAVMDITKGRGAGFGIDSLGGTAAEELASCISFGGIVVSVGLLSGIPVDWVRLARTTGIRPAMYWLRHWVEKAEVQEWHEPFVSIMELVHKGLLQLDAPGARFAISDYQQAIAAATAPGQSGKTVFAW